MVNKIADLMSDQLLSIQEDSERSGSAPARRGGGAPTANGDAAGACASARGGHADSATAAWVALLRGHAGLRRIVAAQLHDAHELTVNEYEALLLLDEAPDSRMRGVDLAAGLQLTPSGVTRLLDGLRARGFIERAHCPQDGRVAYAVLLDAGRAKLRRAACSHVAEIKALLAERFSDQELATLAALLSRLPGAGCSGEGTGGSMHAACPQRAADA